MKRTLKVATVLVTVMLSPSSASAQDPATAVWNQLQAMHTAITQTVPYDIQKYVVGKLTVSAEDKWTFNINKGFEVTVIGACDADCADLDLQILDASGNVIVQDVLVDDRPVVTFTANTNGQFTVVATMVQCSAEPCYFGFGLMTK
jgi:hypothetical protein